ncbi:MAG TPA: hypothetical protein VIK38_14820 [Coriobacteriia bacterium]
MSNAAVNAYRSTVGPRKVRGLVVGTSTYRIAAGQRAPVSLPLSKTARTVLRRYGYLRIRHRLSVIGVSPTGERTKNVRTVVLKTPVKTAKPKKPVKMA